MLIKIGDYSPTRLIVNKLGRVNAVLRAFFPHRYFWPTAAPKTADVVIINR